MANTYKALSTVTVGAGGAASINFTNIPQTYTDLVLLVSPRDNRPTVQDSEFYIQFNANTSNYSSRVLYAGGSTPSSFSNSTYPSGVINSAGSTANTFGSTTVYIPNYAQNTLNKSLSIDSVDEGNVATGQYIYLEAGLWANTSPITQITLTTFGGNSFVQYTTATLYGVFNADVSSAPATPTIGTATATGSTTATVAFTGVSNAASYTATSTPGSITGTGTTSPLTVTGLTGGTNYTFKVKSNNPFGSSAESAASNSITTFQPAYESIATQIVSSGTAGTLDFTSIPSTYKHLQLRGYIKFNGSGQINLRVGNGSFDTGANYSYHFYYATGGSLVSNNATSQDKGYIGYYQSANSMWASFIVDILDYANTDKYKTIMSQQASVHTSDGIVMLNSTNWRSKSAIDRIRIYSADSMDFQTNCHIALYGIRG